MRLSQRLHSWHARSAAPTSCLPELELVRGRGDGVRSQASVGLPKLSSGTSGQAQHLGGERSDVHAL
eukprot:scaffold1637_cov410-Prasinococcus_capsulatus_cf.AAC.7